MRFTIYGQLPSLNDYTKACRSNKYSGSAMKKKVEQDITKCLLIASYKRSLSWIGKYPVMVKITWYEPNMKRDIDNITFGTKFILDSLVKNGVLKDDSRRYVSELNHTVLVDKKNPRIEVEIIERGE